MPDAPNRSFENIAAAALGLAMLFACSVACSKSEAEVEKVQRRDLTIENYAGRPGIGHGDGSPGGCRFTYKGTTYSTPPMVPNGGKMFRCDVKPDSDEPVIRIAFYRPEDDWTCGTRFGETKAKCLPDSYEAVGGILTIRNGELALEDHGFWDVSYDWGEHSVKFRDGREFDYKDWKWTGCGDDPIKYVKSASLTVASGRSCNSDEWHRVYVAGKEMVPEGAGNRPFDSVGINQDASVPSATAWIGHVKGFIYLSKGRPVFKEVGNSPEFIDDGKAAQWWAEDYQTRYQMRLSDECTTSQTRLEVQAALEKRTEERDLLKQTSPQMTSDEYSKFEIDYKERHGQFHLGDLLKFDEQKDIGAYPYSGKKLLAAPDGDGAFFVFELKAVTETPRLDATCIGTFVRSIFWVRVDKDMIARDARSQVISSCLLGRKQIGQTSIVDDKMSVSFEDALGNHQLSYDNADPSAGIRTK